MIPQFRPHRLQYQVLSEGYEDENGDYHSGEFRFEGDIPCRFEPNGKATTIAFEDGKTYVYQYVVYLDQNCREFKIGDIIRLLSNRSTIAEKQVQGFHRGQLNAKLWV
ncbi:hypothetical protein [Bacteroides sp.]|uniref:hypothetical protein n=1 Tax=Bacteroides sp. TaxID=29523 RepID=UPI00263685F1|nr:hypothetical protein [Bacteroides sp.]